MPKNRRLAMLAIAALSLFEVECSEPSSTEPAVNECPSEPLYMQDREWTAGLRNWTCPRTCATQA